MEQPSVDREELYKLVWAEPMMRVAIRFGVSGSFLARVCDRMNVPRPPRGYWAMLKFGKAPAPPNLPAARAGDELEWSRGGEPRRMPRALPKAPEAGSLKRTTMRVDQPSSHELLVGAREHFEGARESDGYLRPSKRLLVDVFVSKETLGRALEVANALFLALERRGHQVVLAPPDQLYQRPEVEEREEGGKNPYHHARWRPARPTVTFVGTVAIGLTLFELSEEMEVTYVDGKYVRVDQLPAPKHRRAVLTHDWSTHKEDMPSGRLCVRASSPYPRAEWESQWRESKAGELPGKITGIVKELEGQAVTIATLVEEGERLAEVERRRWEAQQEERRREEAERRRVKNVRDSREQLLAIVEAWGVAKQIERFFEDAEHRAASLDPDQHIHMLERVRRARELLGGVDALQRFRAWMAPEERDSDPDEFRWGR